MKKIIVKNFCDFYQFGKVLSKEGLVNRAKSYFKSKGVELEFLNEIAKDNYIEIMHADTLAREDKNFLLKIFQRGFEKNVAFIKSEQIFFALVDDFVPAVI